MFAEHAAECRAFADEANDTLRKLRTAPVGERSDLSSAAYSLLRQADESLKSMQMEARASPELRREEELLRKEMRRLADELETVQRELLLGAELGMDKLFLAREERRRTTASTASLQNGCDKLREARRQTQESENIGIETLQELRRQREVIMSSKDKTNQLGDNLGQSQQSLKNLEAPACSVM